MGLFGLFGKKAAKAEMPPIEPDPPFLEDYAGIRAEVTDLEGQLLFTAKLLGLEEDHGDLHLLSGSPESLKSPFLCGSGDSASENPKPPIWRALSVPLRTRGSGM